MTIKTIQSRVSVVVAVVLFSGFGICQTATGQNKLTASPAAQEVDQSPLRIIAFGAHPDDCELKAAGVAALCPGSF
ncbi:MAG: hypothetical protein PHV28_14210 [Kiritimatiellae bacterium]|nr:hypothetical protein [Kiritimatiellia bacterium]